MNFRTSRIRLPKANCIDVTLRDGGFLCGFSWPKSFFFSFVKNIDQLQVPYIELGYLGGIPELHGVDKPGFASNITFADVESCSSLLNTSKLILMVHPGSVSNDIDFHGYAQSGLSGVRFVYHSSWRERIPFLAEAAKAAGLFTALNIALASQLSDNELLAGCELAKEVQPDVLYLADTCSALSPSEVTEIFTKIRPLVGETALGFHGHDFLDLAFSNTLAASHAGATFIDYSFNGLGRGAGNLTSERWLTFDCIQNSRYEPGYLELLDETSKLVRDLGLEKVRDDISIISAALNASPPEEELLRKHLSLSEGALFTQLGRAVTLLRERSK